MTSSTKSTRTVLGSADVPDGDLIRMVARQLCVDEVEVLSSSAEVAAYDIDALTTAGRYWVRGEARHPGGTSAYAFFVKVVQSWTRTPAFAAVPEHLREVAAASLPWHNEPLVYRSGLATLLPPGLCMPRAHAVLDLDAESAAMWLDAVDTDDKRWDAERFASAARLLGRLAASPAVAELRRIGSVDVVRGYAHGRIEHQVLPVLRQDALWEHPLVAGAFSPTVRARLLAAADALPALLAELDGAALGSAHGDASPRNLLVDRARTDGFTLIDFGFWCEAPLGFDLTQLLIGEVQLGERPAAELVELEGVCIEAYVEGLRQEGCAVPLERVRRAHALLMLLFAGITAVPIELAFGMAPPGDAAVVAERARSLEFVLDLVEATTPA